MTENLDRVEIIATLKREALTTPEEGWVSDLGSWDLEWSEFDEAIVLGHHEGSIDVGHLAGIVEKLVATATKPLNDRVEAAEQALDFHTQRDRELKTLLSTLSDRLDEFSYDELSSLIEDEPMNQWGESYTSKLQAAEAAVQRVRDMHFKRVAVYMNGIEEHYCAHDDSSWPCDTIRALDGGEQE
ncbi:hypothetical protein [Glutamicibacter creatinolyticus]|uniref:hypothetical protein n=1 Tax=Glutamicibacter creatinolyticus TaxID=162496 RepID=UPI0031DD5AA9